MGKALPHGSKLGQYTIERVLQRTGLSEVYEAQPEGAGEGRPCRIAVFRVDPTGEPWQRFEKECQALKALGHPAIAEVRELAVSPDGVPYVVYALPAGEDLAARLRRAGALTTREVLALARQVASALHAAHGIEQLHRDLTPESLFLSPALSPAVPPPASGPVSGPVVEPGFERAVVLGFGVSRMLEAAVEGTLLVGRAEYLAPEQITGFSIEVGPAADQYTLALILYQALTVTQPFRGESVGAALLKVVRTAPEPLRALRPDVPVHVDAALLRALSKDQKLRYPDLPSFIQALQGEEPLPAGLAELTDAWLKGGASTEAARQRARAIEEDAAPSLQNVAAGLSALEPVPVVVEDQATVPNSMEDVMRLAVPPARLRVVEMTPLPQSAKVKAPAAQAGSGPREASGRIAESSSDSQPHVLWSGPVSASPSGPAAAPAAPPAVTPAAAPISSPAVGPLASGERAGKAKLQASGISEEVTSPDKPLKPAASSERVPAVAAPSRSTPQPAPISKPGPVAPAPAAAPQPNNIERALFLFIGLLVGLLVGWVLRGR